MKAYASESYYIGVYLCGREPDISALFLCNRCFSIAVAKVRLFFEPATILMFFSSFSCIFFAITLLIGANGLNGTVRSTSFTGILVILYPLEIQKDTKTSPYHTQENND